MTHILKVSADAIADLHEIAAFIRRDNPARADSFTAELRAHARAVASHPLGYRTRAEFGMDIRVAGYRGYLLFYRVIDMEMRLLRVMHAARDLGDLTFD